METTNILIPKHRKLSENEIEEVLEKHSLESITKLPKIKKNDSALAEMETNVGDVIEITRRSFAGSNNKYYRVVIE